MVAIVIPSLNPDSGIVLLLRNIRNICQNPLIVINDGSRQDCNEIFGEIEKIPETVVLTHSVNLGKGRALKTAFNYYLCHYPAGVGVVTADGDGQHCPEDILHCIQALEETPDFLILGARDFSKENVPWKSFTGNMITKMLMSFLLKTKISDTQTGLRGLPRAFLVSLMNCEGERFEFETQMLLIAPQHHCPLREIPIQTIYLNSNRETHFDPLRDSIKIYILIFRFLFRQFFPFLMSGVASAVLDLTCFAILFHWILPRLPLPRLIVSVAVARCISCFFNYIINRNCVFHHHDARKLDFISFSLYILLVVGILIGSYYGTRFGMFIFPEIEPTFLKMTVDLLLFLVSYTVQKVFIFHPTESKF